MNGSGVIGFLPQLVAATVAFVFVVLAALPRLRTAERGREVATPADPFLADAGAEAGKRRSLDAYLQLMGLALAAVVWMVAERPGLAFAILALWTGAVLLARARRRNREAVEEEQVALDAIGSASRALRAGIPVSGMLAILAGESRGVAGRAFREIVRRESLGEELDSAVRRVLLASTNAPLRAFGLALLVHGGAGGNLADSADRLARSLVERGRVRRRSRTVTAYGRTAGLMLAVMPILVIALMSAMVDGYSEFVFDRPVGNLLVGMSAALVMVGVLAIQRISRIEDAIEGAGQ